MLGSSHALRDAVLQHLRSARDYIDGLLWRAIVYRPVTAFSQRLAGLYARLIGRELTGIGLLKINSQRLVLSMARQCYSPRPAKVV